jgi:hypothetical protein
VVNRIRVLPFDGTSDIQEINVLGDWAFMWAKLTGSRRRRTEVHP